MRKSASKNYSEVVGNLSESRFPHLFNLKNIPNDFSYFLCFMVWLPTAEQLYIIAGECTMGMVRLMKNGFCLRTAEKASSSLLLPLSVPHTWSPGLIWPCSRQVNSRKSCKCRCLHNFPWHTFAPTLLP